MPSGKPVDWALYDDLLRSELPSLTIKEWQKMYAPHISNKTIGSRARKLVVKPAKYELTLEHKMKISHSLIGDESHVVSKILEIRQDYSNSQIMGMLGIDDATLSRIYKRNNIRLNEIGVARARKQMRECSIGKMPWNKNSKLSEDTKLKISMSLLGSKNGQFGKKLSKEHLLKRAVSFNNSGREKLRSYLASDTAKGLRAILIAKLRTPEYRERASVYATERSRNGLSHSRGKCSHVNSIKGGRMYVKSSYESKYVDILDSDPSVASFKYEPIRIKYSHDNLIKNYTPDFLVVFADGRIELVEIKPAKMIFLAKNQAKFEAAMSYAKDNSMEFRVVTEDGLFTS